MNDADLLKKAIELSGESMAGGGFPVGALVVIDGEIVGEGISDGKNINDATSHAEIDAIRKTSSALNKRGLKGATVYSSMEPCLMCFSACYWAKVNKIVYAIPKTSLSKEHYEGLHELHTINKNNNRELEILHIKELENEAMEVVREWENT